MQQVRRFGAFWYDFLVGDRWELFVGPIVALAIAWVLLQAGVGAPVVGVALLVMILVVGGLTIVTAIR